MIRVTAVLATVAAPPVTMVTTLLVGVLVTPMFPTVTPGHAFVAQVMELAPKAGPGKRE